MKVKCKKFLSPFGDGFELDSIEFLTKEKEYIVLAISIDKLKDPLKFSGVLGLKY